MILVRTTALLALFAVGHVGVLSAQDTMATPKDVGFQEVAAPFLKAHCIKCHGPTKQSGKVRFDDLTADVGKNIDRWMAVRDQLRDGLMPPPKEARPSDAQARAVIAWVSAQTGIRAAKLPNQGNLIPHELLFGKPAEKRAPGLGRIWRLSPEAYMGFIREVQRSMPAGIVQPFSLVPERGIKDFAGLYTIDEPTAEILLRNSELIVEAMTAHTIKDGKVQGKNDSVRELVALMDPDLDPSPKQLEVAVQTVFKMAVARQAKADELARYLGLYEKCAKLGSKPAAVKTMLQAVLLRTDAMFRSELGRGKDAGDGRRMWAPDELARALRLALGDRRDSGLVAAAQKEELVTREQVAVHVRRILDDPKNEKPRMLKFFREYFEYGKAIDLFKDKPAEFVHDPRVLVSDTDRLILHILKEDKDVFRQLLTTELSFANYNLVLNKKTRLYDPKPAVVLNPKNKQKAPEYVYGFDQWPDPQPAKVPDGKRLGILMQPSWLIAHATNFDNDPVRRGRWVRERLLGGTVPELPIGVVAQVPDDKHRTFRDRLQVTRDAKCWKCHRMMDDLGLPFEQFDHFGLYRTSELVLDLKATEKNVDKKSKALGAVLRSENLDTTGKVTDSGDTKIDGDVKDPREMVRKIAESARARQVFVRHAFRFFLGRNESLSDAKALQDADRTFVESNGSFKALVTSLLTSDAYLYRTLPTATAAKGESR